MHETTDGTAGMAMRAPEPAAFVATLVIVLLTIAAFLVLDVVLAGIDRRESDALAASNYSDGTALLAKGDAKAAADRFADAVAGNRRNTSYALALAEALLRQGEVDEAEATLRPLLDQAENDGAVNLTMAHVMLREARFAEAKAYYHRAIFGRWGEDSVARRTAARFELIDLLARRGDGRELLAELLPLEDVPSDSMALRLRLGRLFLVANSPQRAANMFREALRRDPADAQAREGMGEAELAMGNFRTAHAELAAAVRLSPGDSALAKRLALVDTVVALDPLEAGLGPKDRELAARRLLERSMTTLAACLTTTAARQNADSAKAILARAPRGGHAEETVDGMISLAGSLWSSRSIPCVSAQRDAALSLVQARIAQ